MNREAYRHLPAVREALEKGDYRRADQLVRNIQGAFSQSYAPLGDLYLDMAHDTVVSNYRRQLDLRHGLALVRYTAGESEFSREVFVSFPDQVLVIRLRARGGPGLRFTLRAGSRLRHRLNARGGLLTLYGKAPCHAEPNYRGNIPDALVYDDEKGMRFVVLARVSPEGGTMETDSARIRVEGAREAVLRVSIATSYNGYDREPGTEGRDEGRQANSRLDASLRRSFANLKKRHIRDFQSLFDRVHLDLGSNPVPELPTDERLKRYSKGEPDTDLEALYFQYGRYLLISSSRPGGIPANLQGIWNPHLRPPWSSNYTTNINVEMNYWPAEVCNLTETHEPLLRFIGDLAETGGVTAKTFFNADGWCCCHNTDLWAMTNPVGDFGKGHPCWANWNMAGAWLCTHLWEHFLFTADTSFLRDYAFSLMKGASRFCLDWLVEDAEGNWITSPSTSPENLYLTPDGYRGATTIGTASDMAMIREIFLDTIGAAEILGTDSAFRDSLKNALNRLYPYQIGEKGNLQEWYHDWEDADPRHRHMSHLFGLYPGHQIGPERTPDLAGACRRSLELRGDGGTGWSKAWKINLWARLLDGDHAYRMLRTHLNYVNPDPEVEYRGGGTYPNLWDAHPPFQIDGNFGGTAGIAEMLLQSHAGEIRLLPALPSAWDRGEVRGLRARGGFEVDMRWEDHRLVEARIGSKRGGGCRIRYGGREIRVVLGAGESKRMEWDEK
jgi:alpha-L-fucosidase 2